MKSVSRSYIQETFFKSKTQEIGTFFQYKQTIFGTFFQ